jgi:hypothetical protein
MASSTAHWTDADIEFSSDRYPGDGRAIRLMRRISLSMLLSQTSTRRVGMCQVGASRKFVSEEAVAILRHRVFAIHGLLAAFRHRAENWGCREAPASLKE